MTTLKDQLVICRGYPASGKSTKALSWVDSAPEARARVNRDELRMALYGKYTGLSNDQERAVTFAQVASVTALLRAGKSVVVDDTNLRAKNARDWVDIAEREGAQWAIWDFETPVEECIDRDRRRSARGGRSVGEKVIRDFAKRYPLGRWPEIKPTPRRHDDPPAKYEPDESKPPAIIVDLDGTLAHNVTGREFFGKGLERVYEDDVDPNVNFVVNAFFGDAEVIFMSGRNESARDETERWLTEKADWWPDEYRLFMRADGDYRPDFIVKAELFDKHVRHEFNVKLALDDRDQVVNLWRGMGIPCWQVAPGAF
ncbi:phosphatase domain-containing protein [Puerhibacterium puerhi]|uniref:phosphatase domain-containing protein n=1 Tax=Puerhibacterium puerhi TaxID=2692623 RepID=UPI001359DF49|nr:AAA family ATPase [Puerhibacterium puerhi]